MHEAGLVEPRMLGSDQPIFGKIIYLTARSSG